MAVPRENNASERVISDDSHANFSHIVPETDPNSTPFLNMHEKSEILSDPILDCISRFLLEEDIDETVDGNHETALRDVEEPFYEIIGEMYTPLEGNQSLSKQLVGNSDFISTISNDQVCQAFGESSQQKLSIENLLTTEFRRGVEEGMKFLPNLKKLSISLPVDQMKRCNNNSLEFRLGEEKEDGLLDRFKSKKSSSNEDLDILEGRNCKIPPLSCEEAIRDETFDKALLFHGENYERKEISNLSEIMKLKIKSQNQDNHTDLRALLISCAEAVSTNNKKIAGELLREIRKQASPIGDGIQRLAFILVDGLEARLIGAGSMTYHQLTMSHISTTDSLKAFHMSTRVFPTNKVIMHFSNQSILNNVGTASEIHVIDFGIILGFQWPSLIQALAKREGGPPKLRITGIGYPQPGFRPDQRVKEVGRMLENYARDFDVPFEYQGLVSQTWESICIDDFSIKDGEVLVINNMCKFNRVNDEPLLGIDSPRNKLLKLILDAKPQIFIHGIFNFSFNPYFITRFKKLLSFYSKYFDILDRLVARDDISRQLIERAIHAPLIINQIACEGPDLVVRMENYKEWHKRNINIGFEQIPLDSSVMKECNRMIRNGYGENFFVEEDCNWFLLGLNGSIHHAISLWKPQAEM